MSPLGTMDPHSPGTTHQCSRHVQLPAPRLHLQRADLQWKRERWRHQSAASSCSSKALAGGCLGPAGAIPCRRETHALSFSLIRCLSAYKPIRCSFCVHNKAGQDAFYEQVLSSEKQLLKESDSSHMRFQFAQGLVGFFFQMQVMKILTLFQTKKLCLSFQQSFSLTHLHTAAFSFFFLSL